MKTARFERLSFIDNAVLASILASLTVFSFPAPAFADEASTENKTSLVFEIKNFQTIKIPDTDAIAILIDKSDDKNQDAEIAPTQPAPEPVVAQTKAAVKPAAKVSSKVPPKAVGDAKVYMHEPEIAAYICPKMGNEKCKIFIAILKAENGTHECTRDNRGLNRNGSIDIGLAQINWTPKSPYTFEQLQDCKFNLDIALKKYEARGFQPWYAYTKGSYKKHLAKINISAINNVATEAVN